MKTKKKLLIIIPVLAVLLTAGTVFALTALGVLQLDPIPYQFPVTPEDPEWHSLSSEEQRAAYQIPESKLKRMTTKALTETLSCHYLIADPARFSTNSLRSAFDATLSNSNGFEELFSRPDVNKALLDKYENTKNITVEEGKAYFETEERTNEQITQFHAAASAVSNIEFLIELSKYKTGAMTDTEFARLCELAEQKNAEREALGDYDVHGMYTPARFSIQDGPYTISVE